jgi:DNA (cytosine-5)-methyltransferase 1
MNNIKLLYIDLFCGAGGTSTGVEYAQLNGEKCAKVIACVNHDPNAILSHQANHPDTLHFTEDIRTLNLTPLVDHLQKMKVQYPDALVVLWASLECTNFSRAKGGQPRDADSRTLAEHLFRYIEAIRPNWIQIENVEEFMMWGELDENGKPVSKDQGSDYLRWVRKVQSYGYNFDWRILNAADFGAYTSRKRFFGQFAQKGLPIAFPIPTYAKNGDEGGLFSVYHKWKPVREVLDFSDEGESIFGRKKPLCEKTLERIYAGLIKFVAGMSQKDFSAFIVKYNSMNRGGHYTAPSIDEPCPTVACQNRLGIAQVSFLSKYYGGKDHNESIDLPAGTVTTKDHHALVGAEFMSQYYGNGFNTSVDDPAPTVTTKDRISLVRCFIDNQYGNGTPSSVTQPCPTIPTNPKQSIVKCKQFLTNPYSFKSNGGSVDKPCFTLIARMDKMPPYLVCTEQGEVGIAIYEDDSPMTRKVKEFMAIYRIIDIKMRMLKVSELKKIMGFPENYILVGTQSEQKKFIGNAVEVNMSRVLCEALCQKLSNIINIAV